MNTTIRLFLSSILLAAGRLDAAADILERMDKAAPSFTGMTSNLKKVTHTAVIDDTAEETGTFKLRRAGRDLQAVIELVKPDPKTIAFQGKKAEIYYPKMKTVQEYNLGKQSGMVEQFLMLGFGTTGKDLAASYNIKTAGEETIAGVRTVRLALTPKDPNLKVKLKGLELWISADGSHPVQQKFIQPSGDYHIFTYLDARLNPGLSEDALKLKTPKGTKREVVQK